MQPHQMTEEEIEIERAKAESLKDQYHQQGNTNDSNQTPDPNEFMKNIFSFISGLFQPQSQQQQNQNQQQTQKPQNSQQIPPFIPPFCPQYAYSYPPNMYPQFVPPPPAPMYGYPCFPQYPTMQMPLLSMLPNLLPLLPMFFSLLTPKEGQNQCQNLMEGIKKIIEETSKESEKENCSIESVIQKVCNLIFSQEKKKQKGQETVAKISLSDERLEDGSMKFGKGD